MSCSGQKISRKDKRLVGLTERNVVLRASYNLLINKYYLDALYENVIVHAVAHPIAKFANWINQNVLDATVNAVVVGWMTLSSSTTKRRSPCRMFGSR